MRFIYSISDSKSALTESTEDGDWYKSTLEDLKSGISKIRGEGDPLPTELQNEKPDFLINWYSNYLLSKIEDWYSEPKYAELLRYCMYYHNTEHKTCLLLDKAALHKKWVKQLIIAESKIGKIIERQVLTLNLPGSVRTNQSEDKANVHANVLHQVNKSESNSLLASTSLQDSSFKHLSECANSSSIGINSNILEFKTQSPSQIQIQVKTKAIKHGSCCIIM